MCYVARFTHLLRTHAPEAVETAAAHFDAFTMAIVESQLYKVGELSGYHRERAPLPRRLGGWAIRNSKRTSHAAFFAGYVTALQCPSIALDPLLGPLADTLHGHAALTEIPCFAALGSVLAAPCRRT